MLGCKGRKDVESVQCDVAGFEEAATIKEPKSDQVLNSNREIDSNIAIDKMS